MAIRHEEEVDIQVIAVFDTQAVRQIFNVRKAHCFTVWMLRSVVDLWPSLTGRSGTPSFGCPERKDIRFQGINRCFCSTQQFSFLHSHELHPVIDGSVA